MAKNENLKETLEPVLRVLKDLGGKFVFTDDDGSTFVLMSKKELMQARSRREQQLPLPPARAVAAAVRQHAPDLPNDVIEAINRDIALSHTVEPDMESDDLGLPANTLPKLRFEPIKGDLAPELQE